MKKTGEKCLPVKFYTYVLCFPSFMFPSLFLHLAFINIQHCVSLESFHANSKFLCLKACRKFISEN